MVTDWLVRTKTGIYMPEIPVDKFSMCYLSQRHIKALLSSSPEQEKNLKQNESLKSEILF